MDYQQLALSTKIELFQPTKIAEIQLYVHPPEATWTDKTVTLLLNSDLYGPMMGLCF